MEIIAKMQANAKNKKLKYQLCIICWVNNVKWIEFNEKKKLPINEAGKLFVIFNKTLFNVKVKRINIAKLVIVIIFMPNISVRWCSMTINNLNSGQKCSLWGSKR